VYKSRVSLAILETTHAGYMTLSDGSNSIRVYLTGENSSGSSGLYLYDANKVQKTFLSETSGAINNQTIATQAWVSANFVPK